MFQTWIILKGNVEEEVKYWSHVYAFPQDVKRKTKKKTKIITFIESERKEKENQNLLDIK